MTETKKCRSCLSILLKSNGFSVNLVGWEKLTYREMFEESVGYDILATEPQYFCVFCVKRLMEWYRYIELCKETQDTFEQQIVKIESDDLVSYDEVTIKNEEIIEHEESVCGDVIIIEPEDDIVTEEKRQPNLKRASQPNSDDFECSSEEPFELEFNVYLRDFWSQYHKNMVSLGKLSVVGQSLSEFLHQIWLFIQPHLKREIVFFDCQPFWHPDEHPQEHQIIQFITIRDPITKIKHDAFSLKTLKSMWKKELYLYVLPYSKNIMTKEQWKLAQSFLYLQGRCTSPVILLPSIEREDVVSSEIMTIECDMSLRYYYKQPTKNGRCLGFLQIKGKTVAEFLQQIWIFVKEYLKREIIFDENYANPSWHQSEKPQEKDLLRFITFKDNVAKKNVGTPTVMNFETWTKRNPNVVIFPYSKNIKTLRQWRMVETMMFGVEHKKELSSHGTKHLIFFSCLHKNCTKSYFNKRDHIRHMRMCKFGPKYAIKTLPLQKCPICGNFIRNLKQHMINSHSTKTLKMQ